MTRSSHLRRTPVGRPNTAAVPGSGLPQEWPDPKVQAVRIVNGFSFSLPGRTRLFFNRVYFASYPNPVLVAPGQPFPRPVPIATIEAPKEQAIVIRTASFGVYEHSGIGVDDLVETPPSRTASYFGFDLRIGNRGITDFNTNLVPQPAANLPPTGGQGLVASVGQSGGQLYPFSGMFTPDGDGTFATYARPGDQIQARIFILRPPNYDVRLFSVKIQGWLANESDLDRMLNMLSG